MKQVCSFLRYQFPAILWCIAIFGLSSMPRVPVVEFPFKVDKIAHLVIYFILCSLVWRAFHNQSRFVLVRNQALLFAFLFSSFYGISDEIHQHFVAGRSADVFDAIADGTGALLWVLLYWRRSRKNSAARADNAFDKR